MKNNDPGWVYFGLHSSWQGSGKWTGKNHMANKHKFPQKSNKNGKKLKYYKIDESNDIIHSCDKLLSCVSYVEKQSKKVNFSNSYRIFIMVGR